MVLMIKMIQVILYIVDNCQQLAILTIDLIKERALASNISDQPDRHRPATRQHPSNHSKHCISPINMRTIHRPVTSLFSIITSLFSYHNIPSAMATPHHHRLLEYNVAFSIFLPPSCHLRSDDLSVNWPKWDLWYACWHIPHLRSDRMASRAH